MSLELIKLLKSLKADEEFKPTAEFRTRLKQRLTAEVPAAGWFVAWPEISWGTWGRRLAPAVAGLVVMLMGATVVMAQKSLPIDRLYPIKIAGERAAMAVMPTRHRRAEVAAGIVDRRLGEIEQLKEKHEDEAAEAAITNYREYLLRAEDFRDAADEAWTGRIDRHWQALKQLEKKSEGKAEEKELPGLPVEIETVPTIVRPTEAELPRPTTGGNKIDEIKSDSGQALGVEENKKGVVLPEIQIIIPPTQDLLSPILP